MHFRQMTRDDPMGTMRADCKATQRAPYPLLKENSLNHENEAPYNLRGLAQIPLN